MSKRILTVLLAGLAALGAACGQDLSDRVLLRYKWNAGEEVSLQVATEAEGDMVMTDMTKEPPEEHNTYIVRTMNMPIYQTVEAVDEEGNGTVAYQMGIMEMDMTAGDQPAQHMVIDPVTKTMTVNGEPVPLPDTGLGYFGEAFRMVMSPLGEVLSFQAPDMERNLLDTMGISATDFAQMARTWGMQLPAEPIPEGYSWAQTKELRTAPTSQEVDDAEDEAAQWPPLAMTVVYTLAGFETVDDVECAKIAMVGAMDMREPFRVDSTAGGADLIVETGLAHMSMHGFVYFDPEAGCVVSTEIDQIMELHQETQGQVKAGGETQDINLITNIEGFVQRATVTREAEG